MRSLVSGALSISNFNATSGSEIGKDSSLFFSYPVLQGPQPPGRWSHSAVAVGHYMVIYGGCGCGVLDDLVVLDVDTLCWRSITAGVARSEKDRPEKVLGHAAAATGHRMWLFGGQQGRSFLRKLYSIDSNTWVWTRHTSDSLPSARAGHAMVTVNDKVYLFGGQGKRLYNDMYILHTDTGEFTPVEYRGGRAPSPRRGMSLAYDGSDNIICFGGTTASGVDNTLAAFSISRGEWFNPPHLGPCPSARSNHTCVTLSPHRLLFFGGSNSQGTFFHDAFVLDTRNYAWHKPQQLNTAPAPRNHHTCCLVGNRVLLYGGINSKQTFDGVVMMESKFDTEISHIAQELQALLGSMMDGEITALRIGEDDSSLPVAPGSPVAMAAAAMPPSAAAAAAAKAPLSTHPAPAHAAAGAVQVPAAPSSPPAAAHALPARTPSSLELMKLQLTDLLMKRNMEEMHAQASRRLEATEAMLAQERQSREALAKELMQMKLIAEEHNSTQGSWKARAQEAEAKVAADAATISELRSTSEEQVALIAQQHDELEAGRQLREGLLKELGIMSSRYAKLQSYHDGRRRPRQCSSAAPSSPSHSHNGNSSPARQASTVGRSSLHSTYVAGVTETAGGSGPLFQFFSERQEFPDLVTLGVDETHSSAPSSTPLALDRRVLSGAAAEVLLTSGGAADYGRASSSSVRTSNMSQSTLGTRPSSVVGSIPLSTRTSSIASHSHSHTTGASSSGRDARATAGIGSLLETPSQLLALLSDSESNRAALLEEVHALQEQLDAARAAADTARGEAAKANAMLAQMQAKPPALANMSVTQLQQLDRDLDVSSRQVRDMLMERKIAEAQRAAAPEQHFCGVCMERHKSVVFSCGHQSCSECSTKLPNCPFCRVPITTRITLFDA